MTTCSRTPAHEPARERMTLDEPPLCDSIIIFLAAVLMTLGVALVYSASVTVRGAELDWHRWWASPLRQCVFAIAGFVAMVITAHLDYRWWAWRRDGTGWRSTTLLVVAAGLLLAMLVPGIGRSALGAQRSIVVYSGAFTLGFQPAEIAKVVLVVWLAAFLTRPGHAVRRFRTDVLPAAAGAGLLVVLTGVEDFGTAALMAVVAACLLLLAGTRLVHLIGLAVTGAAAFVVLLVVKPHRLPRLLEFFSGSPDTGGASYHVTQSLIAIGSGGWWGRGLGAGVQKYGYLPQDNNDFILAIICEELGVVAGIVIALFFLALLWRGWRIAARAADPFGRLLAVGLTLLICLQAAFNIGVVTNSIPTKGISLPFVSAGGSGVLFLGIAAGLLASVGREPNGRG